MMAVIPVRDAVLPVGADEAVAEAGGAALVAGEGARRAAADLQTATGEVQCAELGMFAPAAWSAALAPHLGGHRVVVLPASADGRHLAPRLAHALGRVLLAGALYVDTDRVVVIRAGGLVAEEHFVDAPVVATLEPDVRGFTPEPRAPTITSLDVDAGTGHRDAVAIEVLAPDPATMDLAEAERIVAGGAGLGPSFAGLRGVAAALGATWGATRVAADAGWVPADRFIGTTGATVRARLYIAFGISGAVQHVAGLGDPDHIVAVNTDPSAPMMAMADLAIVSDAPAVVRELGRRLGVTVAAPASGRHDGPAGPETLDGPHGCAGPGGPGGRRG